tara:strand:- start:387 stop:734 length:348 start_codon:yes stop_codon:yes gene_type:complete
MSENEESVEENPEAQAETTAEAQNELNESAIDQEVIQAIPINLTIEVGSTTIKLRDLLKLSQGSLLELDRTAGELMDIKVNNTVIAKGEVVETSEGKYGITVVEIVAPLDRIKPA